MTYRFLAVFALGAAFFLTSCSGTHDLDKGQYWERDNASDMAYINGPKAQQMLNRDISRCVTELREMERLGQIKDPIPVDSIGRIRDADQRALAKHDVTNREGYLYAEHSDYHDFESCMHAKGWNRTQYVPYDVADRAKKTYLQVLAEGVRDLFVEDEKKSLDPYNDYQVNN